MILFRQALKTGKSAGIAVHQLIIASEYKSYLIWDLARFGVSRVSLFPNLDGLAGHINWMYSTYDPAKAPKP